MEFVFVVPRRDLFADCYPQGFLPFGDGLDRTEFERRVHEHGFFVERARAERDPDLKQIIPYTVVARDGAHGVEVLLLRRSARGVEARLHDKLSIGVGGHVDAADAAGDRRALLERGARRELDEELVLERPPSWRRVGLLNDDSNPVGAVHLGLVAVARVEGAVQIREKDLLEGEFTRPSGLLDLLRGEADFETWSALLVERLADLLAEDGSSRPHRRETSGALA